LEIERNTPLQLPLQKGLLSPHEKEPDIARNSPRILEHLRPKAKAERPEVIAPEFIAELGPALQRLLPVG
jgi:hypothetical protein